MFVEFLVAHDLLPNLQPTPQVTVLELGDADSSSVVTELRTNGIRVTVDFTNRKLDRKIKAAVKAGVSYVMFVGNDELTSGNFPLKNLVNGEQNTLDLEQIIVTVSS